MSEAYISVGLRAQIMSRAAGNCEYCRNQSWYSGPFSVDHIMPISKGGSTDLENLAWACMACNLAKADRVQALDSYSAQTVILFNPRSQLWHDNFCWNDDCTLILGITATGRATIDALNLNRADAVHLRKVLVLFGDHPPK